MFIRLEGVLINEKKKTKIYSLAVGGILQKSEQFTNKLLLYTYRLLPNTNGFFIRESVK